MVSVFGATTAQVDLPIARNEQDAKRAFVIADAGVRTAFKLIGDTSNDNAYANGFADELSSGGTGGALAVSGSSVVTLDDGNQYRFFAFGGTGTNNGYYIRAVDNYDNSDQTIDSDSRILIVARGQVGTAQKVIEALATPPQPCGFTAGGQTEAEGNFSITPAGGGACLHTNDEISKLRGSVSFPDGVTVSSTIDCNGNPTIGTDGGGCNNALENQPTRTIPEVNIGTLAQYVADLSNADPSGPFYIINHAAGTITHGSTTSPITCVTTDTVSGQDSDVGTCSGGVAVTSTSSNFVSLSPLPIEYMPRMATGMATGITVVAAAIVVAVAAAQAPQERVVRAQVRAGRVRQERVVQAQAARVPQEQVRRGRAVQARARVGRVRQEPALVATGMVTAITAPAARRVRAARARAEPAARVVRVPAAMAMATVVARAAREAAAAAGVEA